MILSLPSFAQLVPVEIQLEYSFYDLLDIPITLASDKGKTQNTGSFS